MEGCRSTVKGRNALLWSPSTPGTLLIARFVMQMPADRASHLLLFLLPLSPAFFIFPLSSFLFPFSSFFFLPSPFFFPLLSSIEGEAFLSTTRVSRIIKGLLSLSVSLSQICRLQFSQSYFSFPFRCAQNFQVSSGWPFVTTSPVQT